MKKSLKRILILLPAIFLLSFISSAQKTTFGLKAGLNLASLDTDDGINFETKTGIHFGGLVQIKLSSHFALQPELVYSGQGGDWSGNKVILGYINIPVIAQYLVGKGFRLQFGPQLGTLISAKQRATNGTETDIDDFYDNVDFALCFGAGYLFSGGFGVDARYNWSFNDIADATTIDYSNRTIQIGVFYQFKKKAAKK